MTTGLVIVAILAVGLFSLLGGLLVSRYRRYRGERIIVCPETEKPAAVELDAVHAALTDTLGKADLHLKSCSRWPERQDCGQECLRQIEVAPEDCLVRNILANWYADKRCVFCGHDFGPIQTWEHQLALLGPGAKTMQWGEVQADRLLDVLATSKPVCWNCHIAESFRRQHPELVVDRPTRKVS